ncbi:MAG: ATP-binding protein [Pseudolabrys sp.]|nr:ATP-binding protein [Pseudolabrys sp.]
MVQVWCFAFLGATALLAAINYYAFISLREQILAREEAQLRQIVDVTGAAVDHLFTTARKTLESLRRHITPETPALFAHELLQTASEAAPFIRVLSVVDVNGAYIHSSRTFPVPEMNLKESPIIAYFRNKGAAANVYFMTTPTRNTLDKEWQVIIGIPRRGSDHAATEILAAVIDTKIIYSEMMSSTQGDGGELTLVDANLNLIASSPWVDEKIGKSLAGSPAYQLLSSQAEHRVSGIVTALGTGVQQISASRHLKDNRLSVAATRPLSIVLHDWQVLSNAVLATSVAILLLMALSAFLTIRDAMQRQRQSDALRLNEQRFRLLVDGATDHAIYMLDTDGRISNWNNGAERISGYSAEEVTGRSFDIFYSADERAQGMPANALSQAMTGVSRSEGVRLRKDGTTYWANVVMSALFDADGKHVGFSKIARDTTEAHFIRQQLKLAKETAESAGAAKSAFLANMSHEIRTPLNGIIGYTDLALEDVNLAPDTRRHIARVLDASKSLHVIIDDILDISKIDARGVELQLAPFDLSILAHTCTSIIRLAAAERNLSVFMNVDGNVPPTLVGDAPRLRQVLINLLNNAVKFTKSGSVTLAVQCLSISPAEVWLRFSVSDTGIGISAEERQRLFQRFSQADSSISRRFGGTGLGLAISKCIVDAMHGELSVSSEPGKGSTFSFDVDLPVSDASKLEETTRPIALTSKPLRILFVDDVEMNRDLCNAILSRAGHKVTVTDCGAAALALVQEHNFDLILTDIQMPEMDGIELTKRVRGLPHGRGELPIIALTANVMADQVGLYKDAGMDDHIGKPIVKAELLAKVEIWGSLRRTVVAPPPSSEKPSVSVHDREAFDELCSYVSGDIVIAMVDELQATLRILPMEGVAVADIIDLRDVSHKATALAGQLGLTELSTAFRSLETACRRGQLDRTVMAHVHHAADRAKSSFEIISAA